MSAESLRSKGGPGGTDSIRSMALFESVVRVSPDAVTATDLEGNIVLASQRTIELHGFDSEDEMIGLNAFDLIADEDKERAFGHMAAVLERGSVGPIEYQLLRKDGSRACGEMCAAVVPGADGAPIGFVATVRDVAQRKASARELRESEERYRNLVEMLPDPVVILQGDRYQYVSQAFTELFGYSPDDVAAGLSFYDLVPEPQRAGVRQRYRARVAGESVPRGYQVELITKDGELLQCETSAALIQYHGEPADLVVIRDVSERRRAEIQLQEVQKIESLGVLAGGIAHDFNNLLVGILANADLVVRALPEVHPAHRHAETIATSARRAAEMCEQLLAYSGRRKIDLEKIDLSALVEEMARLLALPLSKKAHIEWGLAPDLPVLSGDGAQLRQVVMNLVGNAAEAVGDRAGTVQVRTGTLECGEEWLLQQGLARELEPGRYVYLEVEDDGCGMDSETLSRAFEPFYTTKQDGRGLGLAAVGGVVRAHGGAIQVTSAEGSGSRFRVLLPSRAPEPVEVASTDREPTRGAIAGKILVVDDEPMVLASVEAILGLEGIECVTAADGRKALATFEQRRGEIAGMIIDLSMPVMGGEELLRAVHEIEPAMRAILTSGYDQARVGHVLLADPRVGFIQKPFDIDSLLGRLHELFE